MLVEQGSLLRKDSLYVSRTREITQEGQSIGELNKGRYSGR